MRKVVGFSCVAAVAIALAGCGVRLQNETPAQFQANPDIGMYPIRVKVTSGAMVSPPVYVFAISGRHKVPLSAGPGGVYRTMFPVKCKESFPLQYLAIWRLQGMATRHELYPAQPQQIKLTPPPLKHHAIIDTSGSPDRKTHAWTGAVKYKIVTDPTAHITGAQIEPVSQDKADVQSAKAIRIVSGFPLDATCGIPTAVQLASRDRKAHANLVITTDVPGIPTWTTRVDFQPSE